MENILVISGGQSVEHEVSLITGAIAINSLDRERFKGIPVFIDKDGKWYTGKNLYDIEVFKNLKVKKLTPVCVKAGDKTLYAVKGNKLKPICQINCAINCLHGGLGENGSFAGLFNLCGIPLVGSNVLASSISMDKTATKYLLRGLNVEVLRGFCVNSPEQAEGVAKALGYPLIVKPNEGGSSIGIRVAKDKKELYGAICFALRFGENAIVEKCLQNFKEINCAAYRKINGDVIVSKCEMPHSQKGLLTFEDKYIVGKREFPAKINLQTSQKIQAITKRLYEKLRFSGVIRIDYFVFEEKVYLNEINSVPGSLAYYLFCDTQKEFSSMLSDMIDLSKRQYVKSLTFERDFKSNIFNFKGSKGTKTLEKK